MDDGWQDVPLVGDAALHAAPKRGSEEWVPLGVAPPPDEPGSCADLAAHNLEQIWVADQGCVAVICTRLACGARFVPEARGGQAEF